MRGSISVRQIDGKVRLFYGVAVLGIIALLAGCSDDVNPTDSTKIPDITYIATVDELIEFARLVNSGNDFGGKTVVLTDDIDLSGNNYDSWNNTFPIGGSGETSYDYFNGNSFDGIFDGNGKKIRGLNINNVERDYIGLFGYIGSDGEVKNLGVVDVEIIGGSAVGAVVGFNDGGKITNCYSTGKVSGRNSVGGIAGVGTMVANSYSSVTVSGGYVVGGNIVGGNAVGGVVGQAGYGGVNNCYSTGVVNGNDDVGGVAGSSYGGDIRNSYSTGAVSGRNGVGGVVGLIVGENVTNCYSISAVSGNHYVGGIVGYAYNASDARMQGFQQGGGDIVSCAALNPSIAIDSIGNPIDGSLRDVLGIGRVVGRFGNSFTGSRNVAFSAMNGVFCRVRESLLPWEQDCVNPNAINGTDITAAEIQSNATIDYLFTDNSVWTLQSGKLPGLFGTAVDMPEHLR